jgi:hypothetical protein
MGDEIMGFATPQHKIRKQLFDSDCIREAEVDLVAFARGAFGFALAMSAVALPFVLAGIVRIS